MTQLVNRLGSMSSFTVTLFASGRLRFLLSCMAAAGMVGMAVAALSGIDTGSVMDDMFSQWFRNDV